MSTDPNRHDIETFKVEAERLLASLEDAATHSQSRIGRSQEDLAMKSPDANPTSDPRTCIAQTIVKPSSYNPGILPLLLVACIAAGIGYMVRLSYSKSSRNESIDHPVMQATKDQPTTDSIKHAADSVSILEACETLKALYALVSSKNWSAAAKYFKSGDPAPDFYSQFERVDVSGISHYQGHADNWFIAHVDYLWPDGTSQAELRSFEIVDSGTGIFQVDGSDFLRNIHIRE